MGNLIWLVLGLGGAYLVTRKTASSAAPQAAQLVVPGSLLQTLSAGSGAVPAEQKGIDTTALASKGIDAAAGLLGKGINSLLGGFSGGSSGGDAWGDSWGSGGWGTADESGAGDYGGDYSDDWF